MRSGYDRKQPPLEIPEHRSKSDRQPKVIAVVGPPGSGKTTYVNVRSRSGDVIWDLDYVYAAISGLGVHSRGPNHILKFVMAMRAAFYRQVERARGDFTIWIISVKVPEDIKFDEIVELFGEYSNRGLDSAGWEKTEEDRDLDSRTFGSDGA